MKNFVRWFVIFCAVVVFIAIPVFSQARPSLALARVLYNTRKAAVIPQGELKEKIDAVEREMAEASRLGKTGEMRRLLAKGLVLLSGRDWDNNLEFSYSLVLRAEEVCVDSSQPYTVRVEQIYSPRVELTSSFSARVSIHKAESGDALARLAEAAGRVGEKVKDLASVSGLARDLMDEPARIETELAGVPDGSYILRVELLEKDIAIGSVTLRVELLRGMHQRMAAIEKELASVRGFEALRPDVLYALDYIRNINRGRVPLGNFNIARELSKSEAVLASLKTGKDPYAGRTGDVERHYVLERAGEIMPYRIYIPSSYKGDKSFPLVVALHGLGGNQDSFFDAYEQRLPKIAEQHGYIMVAPLGYRVDGGYGVGLFRSGADPALSQKADYSEADVMNVLELMQKNYRIDENRIYLMGHSMGAIGTWFLGAKYPDVWAALAPFAGSGNPATMERMKKIPEIVVHGDADLTVPVAGSRAMVEAMKKLSVDYQYIEVPGGDHVSVVTPNMDAVFNFFDKHRKTVP